MQRTRKYQNLFIYLAFPYRFLCPSSHCGSGSMHAQRAEWKKREQKSTENFRNRNPAILFAFEFLQLIECHKMFSNINSIVWLFVFEMCSALFIKQYTRNADKRAEKKKQTKWRTFNDKSEKRIVSVLCVLFCKNIDKTYFDCNCVVELYSTKIRNSNDDAKNVNLGCLFFFFVIDW